MMNKTKKDFFRVHSNNINICRELIPNNADFFRIYDKRKTFSDELLLIMRTILYLTDQAFLVSIENEYSSISKMFCGVSQESISGPLFYLIYANDMKQAVLSDLLLYAYVSCFAFQDKHDIQIEINLKNDFSNLCEWFLENELSIYFGEDKIKSILFGTKCKLRKTSILNITYQDIDITKNSQVTYHGCIPDETMSDESMA